MVVYTEGQHSGEFIMSEANGQRSRKNITLTVAAGAKLQAGHVLGVIAATGFYAEYDNAGSDGTEAAAAILYSTCDNTDGVASLDFSVAAFVRDAEVRKAGLQWAAAVDATGKTAAYAELAVNHVIALD